MTRYLKFAELFADDGNLNMKGMTVKSIAFAAAYYACMKAMVMME
jgi:hypothetical protein